MEKCESDLENYLKSKLDLDTYACLFYQLINGMDYLRNLKIIHCDIKLKNLLISRDNKLKICDFGFSFYLDKVKGHFCGKEQIFGSPIYLPPEAFNNKINYNNFAFDLWACGIVLYNMLKNNSFTKNLYGFEDLKARLNDIENFIDNSTTDIKDTDARDLLKKMLKLDPNDRITIEGIKAHRFYIRGHEKYKELYKA